MYGAAAFFAYKAEGNTINIDSEKAKEIYENIRTSASTIAERLPGQIKRGMDTTKKGIDIASLKISELKEKYASQQESSSPEIIAVNEYERMTLKEMITKGLSALNASDFTKAGECFEHALARNPQSSNAYIGKLMVKHQVRNANELVALPALIENDELFQTALKFANPKMKEILSRYITVNRLNMSRRGKKG